MALQNLTALQNMFNDCYGSLQSPFLQSTDCEDAQCDEAVLVIKWPESHYQQLTTEE